MLVAGSLILKQPVTINKLWSSQRREYLTRDGPACSQVAGPFSLSGEKKGEGIF